MATSKAVNRPVDAAQKERDVNSKLQLYGMYNGKSSTQSLSLANDASSSNLLWKLDFVAFSLDFVFKPQQ